MLEVWEGALGARWRMELMGKLRGGIDDGWKGFTMRYGIVGRNRVLN